MGRQRGNDPFPALDLFSLQSNQELALCGQTGWVPILLSCVLGRNCATSLRFAFSTIKAVSTILFPRWDSRKDKMREYIENPKSRVGRVWVIWPESGYGSPELSKAQLGSEVIRGLPWKT